MDIAERIYHSMQVNILITGLNSCLRKHEVLGVQLQ